MVAMVSFFDCRRHTKSRPFGRLLSFRNFLIYVIEYCLEHIAFRIWDTAVLVRTDISVLPAQIDHAGQAEHRDEKGDRLTGPVDIVESARTLREHRVRQARSR